MTHRHVRTFKSTTLIIICQFEVYLLWKTIRTVFEIVTYKLSVNYKTTPRAGTSAERVSEMFFKTAHVVHQRLHCGLMRLIFKSLFKYNCCSFSIHLRIMMLLRIKFLQSERHRCRSGDPSVVCLNISANLCT